MGIVETINKRNEEFGDARKEQWYLEEDMKTPKWCEDGIQIGATRVKTESSLFVDS
jgi:hypothetical protein